MSYNYVKMKEVISFHSSQKGEKLHRSEISFAEGGEDPGKKGG